MEKIIPQIIKEHGFDFRWDNKKLWSLDLPIEEIDAIILNWILDLPFWSNGDGWYNLSAREVMLNLEKYPYHKDRIINADIQYPIDIMLNSKEQWLILDGLHRLVRLILDGQSKIKVRKVDRSLIDKILKDY